MCHPLSYDMQKYHINHHTHHHTHCDHDKPGALLVRHVQKALTDAINCAKSSRPVIGALISRVLAH